VFVDAAVSEPITSGCADAPAKLRSVLVRRAGPEDVDAMAAVVAAVAEEGFLGSEPPSMSRRARIGIDRPSTLRIATPFGSSSATGE